MAPVSSSTRICAKISLFCKGAKTPVKGTLQYLHHPGRGRYLLTASNGRPRPDSSAAIRSPATRLPEKGKSGSRTSRAIIMSAPPVSLVLGVVIIRRSFA